MKLIDVDELWNDITKEIEDCEDILEIVEKQPIVVPGRKKGLWLRSKQDFAGLTWEYTVCSLCGAVKPTNIFADPNCEFNFCSTCGAAMSEGGKE